MPLRKYWWAAAILIILGTALINPGFMATKFYPNKSISSVKSSPALYKDKVVTIAGKVVDTQGFMDLPIFRVADKSGDIWVVFDDKARQKPRLGRFVMTKGTVEEVNVLGFRLGVVMDEQKRLFSCGGQKTDTIQKPKG